MNKYTLNKIALAVLIGVGSTSAILPQTAEAATAFRTAAVGTQHTVSTADDFMSKLQSAKAGDTLVLTADISVGGSSNVAQLLDLNKDITIQSQSGQKHKLTLGAYNGLSLGGDLTLKDITLDIDASHTSSTGLGFNQNVNAQSAIYVNGHNFTLDNVDTTDRMSTVIVMGTKSGGTDAGKANLTTRNSTAKTKFAAVFAGSQNSPKTTNTTIQLDSGVTVSEIFLGNTDNQNMTGAVTLVTESNKALNIDGEHSTNENTSVTLKNISHNSSEGISLGKKLGKDPVLKNVNKLILETSKVNLKSGLESNTINSIEFKDSASKAELFVPPSPDDDELEVAFTVNNVSGAGTLNVASSNISVDVAKASPDVKITASNSRSDKVKVNGKSATANNDGNYNSSPESTQPVTPPAENTTSPTQPNTTPDNGSSPETPPPSTESNTTTQPSTGSESAVGNQDGETSGTPIGETGNAGSTTVTPPETPAPTPPEKPAEEQPVAPATPENPPSTPENGSNPSATGTPDNPAGTAEPPKENVGNDKEENTNTVIPPSSNTGTSTEGDGSSNSDTAITPNPVDTTTEGAETPNGKPDTDEKPATPTDSTEQPKDDTTNAEETKPSGTAENTEENPTEGSIENNDQPAESSTANKPAEGNNEESANPTEPTTSQPVETDENVTATTPTAVENSQVMAQQMREQTESVAEAAHTAITSNFALQSIGTRLENSRSHRSLQGLTASLNGMLSPAAEQSGVWVNAEHNRINKDQQYKFRSLGVQIGYDQPFMLESGVLRLGSALDLEDGKTRLQASSDQLRTRAYGVSLYAAYELPSGKYFDVILRAGRMNSKLQSGETVKFHNHRYSAAVAYSQEFMLAQNWSLEPQLQMTYSRIGATQYRHQQNQVHNKAVNSLVGGVGAKTAFALNQRFELALKAMFYREFAGKQTVRVINSSAMSDYRIDNKLNWATLGIGAKAKLSENSHLYFDMDKLLGGKFRDSYQFNLGVNWKF